MLNAKLQSRNDTVITKQNDAAAFYQQTTIISCKETKSWLSNSLQNPSTADAIYAKATPLKKVDDVGATTALLQKYIDYTVHQQRENEKKDEAIDRH
ncbi:hypothetical protein F511_11891 [Dorcoceras hygrometricum]|uniref:Uncharacterized protein n=1 Tax=Dorcoceras hygrometricum TaxID=472368 RepID=A0A2Z7CXZ4_9LAMI|nr:hypothetical protein F511_11891 [Dorcoceras hygrometricum]